MKTKNTLSHLFVWILITTGTIACSDPQAYPENQESFQEGIPLSLSLSGSTDYHSSLKFGLYIFSRTTENENYHLDSIILPLTENSCLRFNNEQLIRNEYRFLFTAGPNDNSALKVVNSALVSPTPGTIWDDIRIIPLADSISSENYYQVTDRSGQDILASDTLYGHLKRTVGQIVYRFFKIGTDITDIKPIDILTVTSVFDRIKSISIEYENYTQVLAFDAKGIPQPVGYSTEKKKIIQKIIPVLRNFRLNLPQTGLGLINQDPANGSEIKGFCFLPNNQQIRTTVTFTYYDTTPTCGDAMHQHDEKCYPQETLTLTIPKKSVPGLSVEANAFTVNKAGIRTNRIIDIGYGTNMEINTDWY